MKIRRSGAGPDSDPIATTILGASDMQRLMHIGREMRKETERGGSVLRGQRVISKSPVETIDRPQHILMPARGNLFDRIVIADVKVMPRARMSPLRVSPNPVGPTPSLPQTLPVQQSIDLVPRLGTQVTFRDSADKNVAFRAKSTGARHHQRPDQEENTDLCKDSHRRHYYRRYASRPTANRHI